MNKSHKTIEQPDPQDPLYHMEVDQLMQVPQVPQACWMVYFIYKSWKITPKQMDDFGDPQALYMGVSKNSVPLNPMVNDHYPY